MELAAVIEAFGSVASASRILLVTDSRYVFNGITKYLPRWRNNQWQVGGTNRRRPLANADLWQALAVQLDRHRVSARWVRGHTGNYWNEFCDRLAANATIT